MGRGVSCREFGRRRLEEPAAPRRRLELLAPRRERLALLLDPGSFVETDPFVRRGVRRALARPPRRPLARRIAEDLRSFAARGVPLDLVGASVFNRAGASPPPKAPTHDAACSPFLRPADPSPPPSGSATPTAHLPVLASAAAPAPARPRLSLIHI